MTRPIRTGAFHTRCSHHCPEIKPLNPVHLSPLSSSTSKYMRLLGSRHHSSSMRQRSAFGRGLLGTPTHESIAFKYLIWLVIDNHPPTSNYCDEDVLHAFACWRRATPTNVK